MENCCNGANWFASEEISYIDCELAPKLHVMKTAVPHFKSAPVDLGLFPKLNSYQSFIHDSEAFKSGLEYADETVFWGWENARK